MRGDLGRSFISGLDVIDEVRDRFPNTSKLAFISIIFSTLLGISMGVFSAIRRESFFDYVLTLIALLGISLPNFWLGILLIYFFSIELSILPIGGNYSWKHYIMPMIVTSAYRDCNNFKDYPFFNSRGNG